MKRETRRPPVRDGRSSRNERQEKKPERPRTFDVKVQRWGINGEGIGYIQKKPVFIPNAIPGETVRISIVKDMPRFSLAKVEKVLEKSSKRQQSPCGQYEQCGGCPLIHADYRAQLQMKAEYLAQSLKKYCGYTDKTQPILKNPTVFYYRNACKLPAAQSDGKLTTGMYMRSTQEFIPIDNCPIHSKVLEKTRKEVEAILNENGVQAWKAGSRGGLRTLVMKEFDGSVQVVLVTDPCDLPAKAIEQISELPQVVSLWQSIKTERDAEHEIFGKVLRHLAGQEKIDLHLGDFKLRLLPRSFFQLNTAQAETLYKTVRDMLVPGGLVVEAYSGIGGISLFCADKAEKIIGIEEVADAVTNAEENASLNHIENAEFICGDAAEELENIADNEDIDTLIVDPPRTGLGERMLEAIKFAMPKNILYVSCNPSTLAKDLNVLKEWYSIEQIQPIDMFSQTSHLETIVRLERCK